MFKKLFRIKVLTVHFQKSIAFFSTRAEINNLLTAELKLKSKDVENITEAIKISSINKIPLNHFEQNCALLKNNEIDLSDISYLRQCLMLDPSIIRNRILVLKEMGSKSITLNSIFRFPSLMRKSLKRFKDSHGFPPEQNMMKDIFSHVGVTFQTDFNTIPSEMIKTGDFYQLCVVYYKTFYLNLEGQSFYKNRKRKYQSITEIHKLMDILLNKFQLSSDFINRHPFLLNVDVDNIEKMMLEFKNLNIDNKNIIDIIKTYPRILCYKKEELIKVFELWKQVGSPNNMSINHIKALLFKEEVFRKRYESIKQHRILSLWINHPRLLCLIYKYEMVIRRLKTLAELDENYLETVNINILLSSNKYFMNYIEGKTSSQHIKPNLSYIISKELEEENTSLIANYESDD